MQGILPIGTVVLLEGSDKKAMIIGVCQQLEGDNTRVWDYVGVPYPEGYLGSKYTFVFDGDQIQDICQLGYQDEEQKALKIRIDDALTKFRNGGSLDGGSEETLENVAPKED